MPLRPSEGKEHLVSDQPARGDGYAQSLRIGTASLDAFHLGSFFLALAIHLFTSLLVGLLYGAMLPMFPRRPILLGGIIARFSGQGYSAASWGL